MLRVSYLWEVSCPSLLPSGLCAFIQVHVDATTSTFAKVTWFGSFLFIYPNSTLIEFNMMAKKKWKNWIAKRTSWMKVDERVREIWFRDFSGCYWWCLTIIIFDPNFDLLEMKSWCINANFSQKTRIFLARNTHNNINTLVSIESKNFELLEVNQGNPNTVFPLGGNENSTNEKSNQLQMLLVIKITLLGFFELIENSVGKLMINSIT